MQTQPPKLMARVEDRTAVLEIYDDIGPSWFGMIDAKAVSDHLQALPEFDAIEVRINSLGGSAFDGLAIHNLLSHHPAPVNVRVDGIAASAASLIAMAGDRVVIPENALLMVHDPSTFAYGGVKDMLKTVDMLEKTIDTAVSSYQRKTDASAETIREWMSDETWFTGSEAVEAGLADGVDGEVNMSVSLDPTRHQYRNAPQQFGRLVALSATAKPPEPPQKEETEMTTETPTETTETAPDAAAVRAEIQSELNKFIAMFGPENGGKWFAEEKTYIEAMELHCASMKDAVKAAEAEIVALKEKLASLDLGEETPADANDPEETPQPKQKQNGLNSRLQGYASSLKMPNRN